MNKGHIHAIGFWIAALVVFLCLFWAYTHGYKQEVTDATLAVLKFLGNLVVVAILILVFIFFMMIL